MWNITVRGMSGLFRFYREEPDERPKTREYGKVFIHGKTHWGWARRLASGDYEFAI